MCVSVYVSVGWGVVLLYMGVGVCGCEFGHGCMWVLVYMCVSMRACMQLCVNDGSASACATIAGVASSLMEAIGRTEEVIVMKLYRMNGMNVCVYLCVCVRACVCVRVCVSYRSKGDVSRTKAKENYNSSNRPIH